MSEEGDASSQDLSLSARMVENLNLQCLRLKMEIGRANDKHSPKCKMIDTNEYVLDMH